MGFSEKVWSLQVFAGPGLVNLSSGYNEKISNFQQRSGGSNRAMTFQNVIISHAPNCDWLAFLTIDRIKEALLAQRKYQKMTLTRTFQWSFLVGVVYRHILHHVSQCSDSLSNLSVCVLAFFLLLYDLAWIIFASTALLLLFCCLCRSAREY